MLDADILQRDFIKPLFRLVYGQNNQIFIRGLKVPVVMYYWTRELREVFHRNYPRSMNRCGWRKNRHKSGFNTRFISKSSVFPENPVELHVSKLRRHNQFFIFSDIELKIFEFRS